MMRLVLPTQGIFKAGLHLFFILAHAHVFLPKIPSEGRTHVSIKRCSGLSSLKHTSRHPPAAAHCSSSALEEALHTPGDHLLSYALSNPLWVPLIQFSTHTAMWSCHPALCRPCFKWPLPHLTKCPLPPAPHLPASRTPLPGPSLTIFL